MTIEMQSKRLAQMLSADAMADVDHWIAKYPPEHRQSAVMAALRITQDDQGGWLKTEHMDAIADYLGMPAIAVYEVASFYSMYNLKPVGRHQVKVCTNISCMLCGSDQVVQHLHQKLGIKLGETSEDGRVTLQEVECQGACGGAPMMVVGKQYHENLTPAKIDQILDGLE